MSQLLINTILLSLVQALIPIHWLPLVSLARSEKWEKMEMINIACISVSAHVLGTAILGIALGMSNSILVKQNEQLIHLAAPIFLIVFGLAYFIITRWFRKTEQRDYQFPKKTGWIIVFIILMFLSPCLEAEYLFVAADTYGTNIIMLLALLYAFINIIVILLLVFLFSKVVKRLGDRLSDKYTTAITSLILILVGFLTFYIH